MQQEEVGGQGHGSTEVAWMEGLATFPCQVVLYLKEP